MMGAFRVILLVVFLVSFELALTGRPEAVGTPKEKSYEEKHVRFRWAFGALFMSEKKPRLVSLERNTVLKSGDQLKAFLELREKCYVYLVYHSAQGEIVLLFPSNTDELSGGFEEKNHYYIPEGEKWFELDNHPGKETFYLIASMERLMKLEALFRRYASLSAAEKGDCRDQILTEIQDLKRRHRQFRTAAERPVQIVGGIRGGDEIPKAAGFDPASMAVEISAQKFYSKTFTIDHQ